MGHPFKMLLSQVLYIIIFVNIKVKKKGKNICKLMSQCPKIRNT